VLKIVKADQAERFARASLDGAAFAITLPGVCAPFGFFDPLDLVPKDQSEILMWREAELTHGRVSMMAAVGFLVQEKFHPIFPWTEGVVERQRGVGFERRQGCGAEEGCGVEAKESAASGPREESCGEH